MLSLKRKGNKMKYKFYLIIMIMFSSLFAQSCGLNPTDNTILDSLDKLIQTALIPFKHKRWSDAKNVKDRLEAIRFYYNHKVINDQEKEKFINALLKSKEYEMEGSKLLLIKLCDSEKLKARAHINKVRREISMIEKFLLQINDQKPVIETSGKHELNYNDN
jgi:hypothetical protein